MMHPPVEKPSPASPHHSPRPRPISEIVMHATGAATVSSTLAWFASPQSKVSSHVVIDKDGAIYRVVADTLAAWHAGKSQLFNLENLNASSLGVELVNLNDGVDPYPEAQIQAAAMWVAVKTKQYRIPINRVVTHKDVALPYGRKNDPAGFAMRDFLLRVAGWALE